MNNGSTAAFATVHPAERHADGHGGHPIRRQVATCRSMRAAALPRGRAPAAAAASATGQDELKLFALSFTAFFVCIYTLIF